MVSWWKYGVIVLLLIAAALVPQVLPTFWISIATEVLIYGLLAMSVNFLGGYGGLVSLGHAGLFGISAYTVGYLVTRMGVNHYVAFLAGVLLTLAVGAIFGGVAIRATGIYFLMITYAEGMVVWGLAYRWAKVTGAENGIRGITRPELFTKGWQYYYVVLVIFVLTIYLMWRVLNSSFGLTLRGIRECEPRMAALGYNVQVHKFLGYMWSAFFAGIAGGLYAYYNRFVSPSTVQLSVSSESVLMMVLGGVGTFFGPLLGSLIIIVGRNMISLYTARWPIIMGTIFVLTVLLAPKGIIGTLSAWWEQRKKVSAGVVEIVEASARKEVGAEGEVRVGTESQS